MIDETPILDHDVLDLLTEKIGEDKMLSLIDQCVEQLDANVSRIVAHVNITDFAIVQREAHDLKGTSGSFGALRLHKTAEALDLACKEGRIKNARNLISDIGVIATEACDALKEQYGTDSIQPNAYSSIRSLELSLTE